MRLLLLEYRSAFAERLAHALAEDERTYCDCSTLSGLESTASSGGLTGYDAIVFDLRRDTRAALKLCRRVLKSARDVPVIAVTSFDDHNEAVRLVQAGVEDVCLRNECDIEYLRTRILCAIERHRVNAMLSSQVSVAAATRGRRLGSCDNSRDPAEQDQPGERMVQLVHVVMPGLESISAGEAQWAASLGRQVEITYLSDLDDLVATTSTGSVDAVVLYVHEVDPYALDVIATVKANNEDIVIVVSAGELLGDQAVTAIQHGADETIATACPTHETVARHVRQGLVRRRRLVFETGDTPDLSGVFPQPSSEFQQRSPRYYLTKSAIAIPIRPDLSPENSMRAEGFTVDVSESGIGFEVGGLSELPSELLLAGVEGDDGVLYFATVEVRNWTPCNGHVRVGAQFVASDRDLLKFENLHPTFQPDTGDFAPGLPVAILHQWVELGIFRPMLVDRIYVCPKCGGLPSVRSGCRSCGSVHVVSHQLLHHYDCSYLGRITRFEPDGTIRCPKCGVSGLVDSDEFELLAGPCHCMACNWSDSNAEVVGQCLRCHWHFPLKGANERELIGYHVNRLDPRTLLGIS